VLGECHTRYAAPSEQKQSAAPDVRSGPKQLNHSAYGLTSLRDPGPARHDVDIGLYEPLSPQITKHVGMKMLDLRFGLLEKMMHLHSGSEAAPLDRIAIAHDSENESRFAGDRDRLSRFQSKR
jgi:hypothetical protein